VKKVQKSILRLRSGLMLSVIEASNFIKNLKFDKQGLIPAIIQDYKTNEVLMLAYMNKESLKKTLKTGRTHFWSRSRKKLWLKGETSGNFQIVHQIFFDCDNDTLLFKIHQKGVACHTGNRSCFYRRLCTIHPKKNL
jgi:phosphoribosyl-AMP cyclohydrolase